MQKRNDILVKVRDAVRHPYAWPGGYPIYTLMSDGETLCAKCVRENYRAISESTRHNSRDGWAAAGTFVLWETTSGPEHCAHCGDELESAYGDVSKED